MDKLQKLYDITSKHSQYQKLPKSVTNLIGEVEQKINRYEYERLEYINSNIDLNNKTILDVGSNTGFFSVSSIESGANLVDVYEGDKSHADFISDISDTLDLNISVNQKYLQFNETFDKKYNLVYLLNVVHHFGDDFGDTKISIKKAKEKMSEILKYFSDKTEFMVFQMGYCWKGDRNLLLFENGSKKEMLSFVEIFIKNYWVILNIGILESDSNYYNLNNSNIKNEPKLKEFGNRPLFILKSNIK